MAGSQKVSLAALLPSFFSFLLTSGQSKTSLAVLWRDSGGEMMLFLEEKNFWLTPGGGTMWMTRDSLSGTLSRALLKTKSSSLKQRFRFSGSGSSYFLLFGWDLMSDPFLSSFHQHCSQTCLLLTAFFTFKLKWVVLVIMSLVLSGSNLFGYLRWQIFNIHEPNTKYFKIPFTWDFIFI